jgi:hypothetical protein
MYGREEAKQINKAFWTTFGKWSTTKRKRFNMRERWLLNKTGIRGYRFRFSAERKMVGVHLDLVEKFPEARQKCVSKLRFLKQDFDKAIQEPIIWNFETPTSETAVLSIEKHGLTTMNREHWPLIFEFYYMNMNQLENVFESSRDFLES